MLDCKRLTVASVDSYYCDTKTTDVSVYQYSSFEWTKVGDDFFIVKAYNSLSVSLTADGKITIIGNALVGNNCDYKGHSVSMSADGVRVVIGHPSNGRGKASIYEHLANDESWSNSISFGRRQSRSKFWTTGFFEGVVRVYEDPLPH